MSAIKETEGAAELLNSAGVGLAKVDKSQLAKVPGPDRALLFMVSLDEYVATKVLGYLSDDEVRRLRASSEHVEEAPTSVLNAVYYDFLKRVRAGLPAALTGSSAYLRRLTGNALGEGRAAELWSDDLPSNGAEAIARLENTVLEALLEKEQPQTVAVVLSQLPNGKAAEIVERMEPTRRADVMLRLARLESVSETVLQEIEKSFEAHVKSMADVRRRDISGKDAAAGIVKRLPNEVGEELLESLRTENEEAAEQIERALFTFEDLMRIDSRGIQTLLKEVPTDQLTLALKTATEDIKEKILGNISSRAADLIHEELELMGPVRLSEVETAQQAIVQVALQLEKDGRIMIAREGGGDFV